MVEESLASGGSSASAEAAAEAAAQAAEKLAKEKESKAYLTPGTEELRQARIEIAKYSLQRTSERIRREVETRDAEARDPSTYTRSRMDRITRLSKLSNFYSEVGDTRPVSSVSFSPESNRIVTGSWSGVGRIWNVTPRTQLAWELKGHKDPISDVAWNPTHTMTDEKGVAIASCSMDSTVMLWSAPTGSSVDGDSDSAMVDSIPSQSSSTTATSPMLTPLATLRGHTDRCCRLAWHPMGRHLASTSYDRTWRLWDIQTQQEILKQQGHSKATYAIAFQKDGALAASGSGTFTHNRDIDRGMFFRLDAIIC